MSELRVLILTSDFPPMRGGIQHLVLRVAEHFPDATVRVVAPAAKGAEAVDRALPFEVVRPGSTLNRQASLAAVNLAGVGAARSFKPDVTLVGHIITSPGAALVQRALGTPFVQWYHANEIGTRTRLAAYAYRSAAASIAVSSFTRELIEQVAGDASNVRVINNGVDLPPADAANGDRPGPPTILTVARLEERYKGHDVLTRALPLVRSRVPDVRWVVVGDGSVRRMIESLAKAYGISDAVLFTGPVSDDERDNWLRSSHVFAMPSRLPAARPGGEGFGIVFLEAGAHGLPVVAGAVGGALDAVVDGETGRLVDPSDHLAVAEALTDLLTDREKAVRMGAAGRRFAEAHSWPVVAGQVEDLLREVAAARRS